MFPLEHLTSCRKHTGSSTGRTLQKSIIGYRRGVQGEVKSLDYTEGNELNEINAARGQYTGLS